MDAAIAWVVQAILSTLLVDKLDAWIRQVGLVDDVEKLKTEIKRTKIVLSTVKEKGVGNERLAEPLALLEDQLYDAHDVVVELDYYRLQDQVQGVTIDNYEGLHGTQDEIWSGDTDTPMNRSVGKLRSAVWKHFTITKNDDDGNPVKSVCRHCGKELTSRTKNGTSSMAKHLKNEHSVTFTKKPSGAQSPNPSSAGEPVATGSSSRNGKEKKRRSTAWDYVDVIEEEENGKPIKARCKYCPTEIKCGGTTGTGGILNHNKRCKKKPGPDDQPSNPSRASEPIAAGSSSRNGKEKKRPSTAWDYVDVIEKEENGKPIKARCKYCPTEIKCGGTTGTAGILNHEKRCKKKPEPNDRPQNMSSTGDVIVISDPSNRKRRRSDERSAQMAAATPTVVGDSSSSKRRRADEECAQITAAMPTVVGDSSSRKRRADEESAQITTATPTVVGDSLSRKRGRADGESAQITAAVPTVVGDSSSRKRRRAGEESVQITAAVPTVVDDSSSRKGGRVGEESAQITSTNIHTPWDKVAVSDRIQKIISQLQYILGEMREALKLHGSESTSSSNHHQSAGSDQDLRTSSRVSRKVYGRVTEKNSTKIITEGQSDNTTVVPIGWFDQDEDGPFDNTLEFLNLSHLVSSTRSEIVCDQLFIQDIDATLDRPLSFVNSRGRLSATYPANPPHRSRSGRMVQHWIWGP